MVILHSNLEQMFSLGSYLPNAEHLLTHLVVTKSVAQVNININLVMS